MNNLLQAAYSISHVPVPVAGCDGLTLTVGPCPGEHCMWYGALALAIGQCLQVAGASSPVAGEWRIQAGSEHLIASQTWKDD